MAKLPVTNALLACVAGAGLFIMYTTYTNLGGSGLSVDSLKALPLFAWHPILMSAGWLLLAPTSWAIITARKSELKKDKRILLTQLHAATVVLGVVSATLGAVAIYLNKEKAGKPHFTSPHSQVGIGFVLLVLSSYASAFFNVATNGPAAPNFNWNSKLHKSLGKACLVGSGLAVGTGLYSRWGKTAFPDERVRAGVALAIIIPQLLVALERPSPVMERGGKRK